MSSNIFLVLSGPSGAGKSTLVRMVLDEYDDFIYSVSVTTRPPRNGEIEGKDYFFVSQEKFKSMIDRGELIEWALVYRTDYYGTPRSFIEQNLKKHSIIIDADVQGGIQITAAYPDAVSVFIKAEDISILEDRLKKRGDVSQQDMEKRLATAREELSYTSQYTYVLTNTSLEDTFRELQQIIDSNRNNS